MFTAALFTIPRTWKQPKCPSTDKWTKKMWCIYATEYYSAIKKEYNNAACSSMDGPREFHTERSKSDSERQTSYSIADMWKPKRRCWRRLFRVPWTARRPKQ